MKEEKLQELLQAIISDLYKYSPDIRRIMTNQLKGVFEETKLHNCQEEGCKEYH